MATKSTAIQKVDLALDTIIKVPPSVAEKFPEIVALQDRVEKIVNMLKYGILRQEIDYGIIPNTKKPTLFKAGAEMLCIMFNLDAEYDEDNTGSDFDIGLFRSRTTCKLYKTDKSGIRTYAGMGRATCSSWESKYRYRWLAGYNLPAEYRLPKGATEQQYQELEARWKAEHGGDSAVKKVNFNGKYTTTYREQNPTIHDLENTVTKMSANRALRAAILMVTGADRIFVSEKDLEALGIKNLPDEDDMVDKETGVMLDDQPASSGAQTEPVEVEPTPAKKAPVKTEDLEWVAFANLVVDTCKPLGWVKMVNNKPQLTKPLYDLIAERYPKCTQLKDISNVNRKDFINCLMDLVAAKTS